MRGEIHAEKQNPALFTLTTGSSERCGALQI